MTYSLKPYWFRAVLLCGALLIGSVSARAQDEDGARRFWPPDFRPAAKGAPAKPAPGRYRRTSPALPKAGDAAEEATLGITVWLVTPPAADGKDKEGARILVPKTGKQSNLIAKRVEASTKFAPGQRVRLSIEVPRSGYLYVIDREQYADGSFSDPYLIYPLDPAGDDNRVTKGRVIEIPNAGEDPYFEVRTLGGAEKVQTSEQLTVLVTPTPLKELPQVKRNAEGDYEPALLPRAQVEGWEKQWATQVEQAELEGGAGQLYTTREQAAGARKERLTQADPLPQTVFRIAAKSGKPLLVKLPLNISPNGAK